MHYTIGRFRLREAQDVVFIACDDRAAMVKKPDSFRQTIEGILMRPVDPGVTDTALLCEIFNVQPAVPQSLSVSPDAQDG